MIEKMKKKVWHVTTSNNIYETKVSKYVSLHGHSFSSIKIVLFHKPFYQKLSFLLLEVCDKIESLVTLQHYIPNLSLDMTKYNV